MNDIHVIVADNDCPVALQGVMYTDDKGPIVFEQYTQEADLITIQDRAKELSKTYGRCRIAKLEFTGEEYD